MTEEKPAELLRMKEACRDFKSQTGVEPDYILLRPTAYDAIVAWIEDPRRGRALGKSNGPPHGEGLRSYNGATLIKSPIVYDREIVPMASASVIRQNTKAVTSAESVDVSHPEQEDWRQNLYAVAWMKDGTLFWRTLASTNSGLPLWARIASKGVWTVKAQAEAVKRWWTEDSMCSGPFLTVRWGDIFGDTSKARHAAAVEPAPAAKPTFVIDGMKSTAPTAVTEWAVQSGDFYLAVSGLDGATWDEASRAQPMTKRQAEQTAENVNRARAATRPSHMRGTSQPGAVVVPWPGTRAEPAPPAPAVEKINPAPPTSSMSLARARLIASGLTDAFRSHALEAHVEDPFSPRVRGVGHRSLPECSLEEMLVAMRLVEESTEPETPRSGHPLRIAPKMIAAMYALERYGNFAKLREALGV